MFRRFSYLLMQMCLIDFIVWKNLNQIHKFMFDLYLGLKFHAEDMSVSDLFIDQELYDILLILSIKIFFFGSNYLIWTNETCSINDELNRACIQS